MTLKSLEHTLVGAESEETLLYISDLLGNQPRTNMTKLGDHCYAIGPIKKCTLSAEESDALCTYNLPECPNTFQRVFLNGSRMHSRLYRSGSGKRNSRVCSFRLPSHALQLGEIQRFILLNQEPHRHLEVVFTNRLNSIRHSWSTVQGRT